MAEHVKTVHKSIMKYLLTNYNDYKEVVDKKGRNFFPKLVV